MVTFGKENAAIALCRFVVKSKSLALFLVLEDIRENYLAMWTSAKYHVVKSVPRYCLAVTLVNYTVRNHVAQINVQNEC